MSADGTFAKPQKLDDEINGIRDDYGLFYSDDETWGYFTSNRDGKDEIYYFRRTFLSHANNGMPATSRSTAFDMQR